MNFEKKFGQSSIFVTSTLMEEGGVPPSSSPAALLKEAIHVISCGYEDKTEWGLEVISIFKTLALRLLDLTYTCPTMWFSSSMLFHINAARLDLWFNHGGYPDRF